MSLSRKSRVLTFRLADEEYQQFKLLCSSNGARTVSEVARHAIESVLQGDVPMPGAQLQRRIKELSDKVNLMDQRIESISRFIGHASTSAVAK